MNTSGSEIKLFSGNSNFKLAKDIAESLGVELGSCEIKKFSDGEISVNFPESVRGKDIYIIQPTSSPVDTNLMELLIMIDALKRASAGRINAVIPYYGYARQDRKAKSRDPITAKDFRAGWLRALDSETKSGNANLLYPIKNGEAFNLKKVSADEVGIKVIDDKTLEVTLEAPTPYFDDLVTFKAYMPLNEKFYGEVKDKYFMEADKTISSGPYLLKEWVRNSRFVFEKNPNYWDAKNVKTDKIVLKQIDSKVAGSNFKNGEVDVTAVSFDQSNEFKGKPELVQANDGGMWYLLFNTNVKPLNNAKVRKAISMAINTKELVEKTLDNSEKNVKSFVPSGIGIKGLEKDFAEEVPTSLPGYNPEEAKKLLAEGLKEEGMQQFPSIELVFGEGSNTKVISEFIQASLKNNLGIDLKLSVVKGKERVQKTKQRNYQVTLHNWTGDFLDPITYLDLFDSKNANNRGDYKNAKYDELVKTAKSTADPKVRVPAMIEMEKIISEEVPIAVLFQRQKRYLVNPEVKDITFLSIGGEYFLRDMYMGK